MQQKSFEPPEEHRHHRWHWIEIDEEVVPVELIAWNDGEISWRLRDIDYGPCDSIVLTTWRYLGPAIPRIIEGRSRMPEFIAKGTIVLSGVDFFITAENEEEALEKAKAGDFDFYETDCAETVDCEIILTSVRPNE